MNRDRPRRCPALGLSPLEALSALTWSPTPPTFDWPQFSGREVLITQSGRTAIALLRRALGLEEGDEVILSAYNCGSEVDALLASGLVIRCVDCEPTGFLSLDSIVGAATQKTRAIYVIHPFGWPQPLDAIDAWRREKGLLLIEDCALSLFSSHPDGTPLGLRGEASIFSFPKTLPTPDGGVLSLASGRSPNIDLRRPPLARSLRQTASRVKAWIQRQRPLRDELCMVAPSPAKDHGTPAIEDMPGDYYFGSWRTGRAASNITRRVVERVDPAGVARQRRENYVAMGKALEGAPVRPLFSDLPAGVCPLFYPVISENRQEISEALEKAGIVSYEWWSGGHRRIDWEKYPVALGLKRQVLPIPVHHHLNQADMRNVARVLRLVQRAVEPR
jgi:dTDP-4-amino-4,6-dideoxygalactose transaminase